MTISRLFARCFAILILSASLIPAAAVFAGVVTPNPIPFVNQPLVPSNAVPGSAGFTLTVNGAGFRSTSVVNWNGSPLNTIFVSSDTLQAAVPASGVAAAGTANVTVSSPAPGGGTSSAVQFTIRKPATTLAFTTSTFATGAMPGGVIVADFDNNGKPDVAVVNQLQPDPGCYQYSKGTISIFLGNGDGTFTNKSTLCYADGPNNFLDSQLVAGDFNGDGKIDLIAFYEDNGGAYMMPFLGNGDGTFNSEPPVYLNAISNGQVATGDFNRDGRLDMAFGVNLEGPTGFNVLCGNGDGSFTGCGGGSEDLAGPGPIATGDFNGDGILDLAMFKSNDLLIFTGNGDGTFGTPTQQSFAFINPSSVTAGDFDGDGKLDLAVTEYGSSTLTVLKGQGDGTFTQVAGGPPIPQYADVARAGDLNGDGKLDLVLTASPNTFSTYLGNGDGTFRAGLIQAVDYAAYGAGIGDFNGDGLPEIALSNADNNTVSILLQTPTTAKLLVTSGASQNPSYVNQSVTYMAFVSGNNPAPTGSVTFKNNGKAIGTVSLASGIAVLNVPFAKSGTFNLVASYSGDGTYTARSAKPIKQVVNKYRTSTFLSSNPNPSHDQSVTFTAEVASIIQIPDGKVTFKNGATSIGTANVVNGTATLVKPRLPVGSLSITATYEGTAQFGKSTSSVLTQVVE